MISDVSKVDLKLFALTSIRLSSKLFESQENLLLSVIHQTSGFLFNNIMLMKAERKILIIFEYNLFIRDSLLVDRLGLFVEAIKPLVKKGYFTKFKM